MSSTKQELFGLPAVFIFDSGYSACKRFEIWGNLAVTCLYGSFTGDI